MDSLKEEVNQGMQLSETEEAALFERLMAQMSNEELKSAGLSSGAQGKKISPVPGFCIKTRTKEGKVFINVCHHEALPAPPDISDAELSALVEDPSAGAPFRVPLSLGEGHAELDRSGNACTVYDAVVNSAFFGRASESHLFHGFLVGLVLEGLENKYNIELCRDSSILKILRMKKMGQIQDHFIRSVSSKKPIIQAVNESVAAIGSSDVDEQLKVNCERPEVLLLREPADHGVWPEFLVAEILLPKIRSAATLTIDIGEDRIVLNSRSQVYHLDAWLPFPVVQEETNAQFDTKSHTLTLTMPVLSKDKPPANMWKTS